MNMRKAKFHLLFLFLILLACSVRTPEEKSRSAAIGKCINLTMFKNVLYKGDTIPFYDFKKTYKYTFLVYLQNNCQPCYDKYILWNNFIDTLTNSECAVLFIVHGKNSEEFFEEVRLENPISANFYLVMDPNYVFIERNIGIPKWLIENSLLINEKNEIRYIGTPFCKGQITKNFKKVINE